MRMMICLSGCLSNTKTACFALILSLLVCTVYGQQTVGLFQNSPSAFDGYTLFAQNGSFDTYLIDNCGNEINTWTTDTRPGLSVYLLEDGNLLRTAKVSGSNFGAGGSGGGVRILDWDSNLLWSYDYTSTTYHQHHDVEYLPNGNVLILAWELKDFAESEAEGRNPNNMSPLGLWPEHIIEVQPTGATTGDIVWEWHFWDHMIQDYDASKNNFGVVADHPELIDLNFNTTNNIDFLHCNAIDYNPLLDQISISCRSYGEIWVIDHSTTTAEAASHTGGNSGKGGDLLYRWGNPQVYDRGANADQQFFGQHDVRWIEPGFVDEGKLMIFNNGVNRPGGTHVSVDIISPPIDANGNYTILPSTPFDPVSPDWSYDRDQDMFANSVSGAHRLPNGNTLICLGPSGRLLEVTEDEEVVWEYQNPISNSGPITQGDNPSGVNIFRATRYAPDFLGLVGKDLSPSTVLELNPLPSTCMRYDTIGIVINEIHSNGNIELKNVSTQDVDISTFWLVNESNSIQLRNANFVCGSTTLAPQDIIVINDFLNIQSASGELALYQTISFDVPSAMIDYVEWGTINHQHATIAATANLWNNQLLVESFNIGESIEYTYLNHSTGVWLEQSSPTLCNENTSSQYVCAQTNLNVISIDYDLYHAQELLTSNAIIQTSITAFKAGVEICLDNGFEVQIGTEFLANIETCP